MTKHWVVESQTDQWEPAYPQFRTTSKEYAEWYCTEVNKCTDNWETYYVIEEHIIPIAKPDYVLTLGFAFNKQLEFVASETQTYLEEHTGYSDDLELILVNGTGSTYEECLYCANLAAQMVWVTR